MGRSEKFREKKFSSSIDKKRKREFNRTSSTSGKSRFRKSRPVAHEKKKKKERGNRAVGRGSLEFYALFIFIYALTVVRVCGIYMRAQARILHVRITRNDRPGWLPLTVRAPAFLRLPSNGLPNYTGQCGQGGGVPRAYVSFTDFSAFIERTRASPPIQIVPRRDVDSTESRLKTG